MSNPSIRTRPSTSLDFVAAITMLVLGAALAVAWARAIAQPAGSDSWPVPTMMSLTAMSPTATGLSAAASTPEPPTGTPQPTATAVPPTPTPTATPTRPPQCQETAGQVVVSTYLSQVSRTEQRFRVYVPPCYERTDRRYPTLYLIHGSNGDDTHLERLGLFDVMNEGLLAGRFAPAIIILPDGDRNLYMNTSGGPGTYEPQIVDELVPLIDRTYRTDAQRKSRAIGGISRGGVWSLEIGFLRPDLFGVVGGHSAALNVNLAPPPLNPLQLTYLPSLKTQHIYLDAGDTDYVRPGVDQLHLALQADGVPHTYQIWPGAHEDALWAAHLADYLDFYTQTWR